MMDVRKLPSNVAWIHLAAQIKDNHHLNKVLMSVPSKRRQEFYEVIRPHLKFEPKPSFSFAEKSALSQ